MSLDQIYTQLVLEEARNTEHRRKLKRPTFKELGHNPSCGDEIELEVELKGKKIKDISYTGHGCAISQASTSIMCRRVKDLDKEQILELCDDFIAMIKGEDIRDEALENLGDAAIFENIKNMPARVKCVLLPWYTLKESLSK